MRLHQKLIRAPLSLKDQTLAFPITVISRAFVLPEPEPEFPEGLHHPDSVKLLERYILKICKRLFIGTNVRTKAYLPLVITLT